MNVKKIITIGAFAFLSMVLIPTQAFSVGAPTGGPTAGGPPGGSPPTGSPPAGGAPCWSPPCIPIDGGIGLLLAAGAIIGTRRIYKGSVKQEENQA